MPNPNLNLPRQPNSKPDTGRRRCLCLSGAQCPHIQNSKCNPICNPARAAPNRAAAQTRHHSSAGIRGRSMCRGLCKVARTLQKLAISMA
jgi:hypothetical protein